MDAKQPLASEMIHESQEHRKSLWCIIRFQWILIAVMLLLLAGTNIYHVYQWSQFDTVVVDSGEGTGNANYVQGDNAGGIFNGTGSSETPEERQEQGNAD